jgi:hypothetical protein
MGGVQKSEGRGREKEEKRQQRVVAEDREKLKQGPQGQNLKNKFKNILCKSRGMWDCDVA